MATENFKKAGEIFQNAIEIENPAERVRYLESACRDNPKLLAEVETLLKAHEQAGDFLENSPVGPEVTLDTAPLSIEPGTIIGRYKLLEKIGEGGMAVVYMAEQKQPIRRRVALKIIKFGMDTESVIARFEAERQALAMMDHPNIAHVFDAGTTESGRPYFVMELVRGVSITEFCDKNNLSTKERLQLFISVCQAVQHAHQKGIIHRDIKSSNVMVTLHDGEPVPKVIDFGIAKAVNQQLTEKTVFTRYAQMIGTPEYMSPEQAELSGLDIDTRSDIYSLGVLLYELLTGDTPFDAQMLREAGYNEMQRIIREEEPDKPSTKLSTLGEALTDVAKHRRTAPDSLTKLIKGDLDWVVMKALEKDRTRRYETANELARDIERHLGDEPVVAGPPSRIYRLHKFIRRNRALVTSAAIVLAVLVAGIVVSTVFGIGQARARAEAERARAEAEFHARVKADVMACVHTGFLAQGEKAAVGEVLDTMAKDIDEKYIGPPLTRANFRQFLGNMYVGLGLYDKAEPQLEKAVEMFQEELGQQHASTIEALGHLAYLRGKQQKSEQALELLRQLLRKSANADSFILEATLRSRFTALMGLVETYVEEEKYNEAIALMKRALESASEAAGEEHWFTLNTTGSLAMLYEEQDRYEEAESLYIKVLEIGRQKYGEEHMGTLYGMNALASLYKKQRRYEEAEPIYMKGLEIGRRVLGERHIYTQEAMDNLAALYRDQKRFDEARRFCTEALDIRRRVLGQKHPETLLNLSRLGSLYVNEGRYEEAKPHFVKLVELDPNDGHSSYKIALLQLYTGDIEGYRKTCAWMIDHLSGSEHFNYANEVAWTCSLAPDAVEDFKKVVRLAERGLESDDKDDLNFSYPGVVIYRAGRFEGAIEKLEEYVSICEREDRSPEQPSFAYTCFFLAMAHHQLGRHEQAMRWLAKGTEQAERERADRPYWWWVRRLTLELFETEAKQLLGVSEQ